MKTHYIDRNGRQTSEILYEEELAEQDDVERVLNASIGNDGRADWVWIRMRSGALILGTYPTGDVYMEMSDKIEI